MTWNEHEYLTKFIESLIGRIFNIKYLSDKSAKKSTQELKYSRLHYYDLLLCYIGSKYFLSIFKIFLSGDFYFLGEYFRSLKVIATFKELKYSPKNRNQRLKIFRKYLKRNTALLSIFQSFEKNANRELCQWQSNQRPEKHHPIRQDIACEIENA